jgi:hypothetical protein
MEILIMENLCQVGEMVCLWKYSQIMNTIMVISRKICFQGRGSTTGITNNTSLGCSIWDRKYGEDSKENFSIKEILKKTRDMEKELVGTQLARYMQGAGSMERDMAKVL